MKNLSLSEIAQIIEGEIKGDCNKNIQGVAPFENATDDDITFVDSLKLFENVGKSVAGAIVVPRDFPEVSKNLILVDKPRVAFSKVLTLFFKSSKPETGISQMASTGKNFSCGKDVSVGDFVVTGNDVVLGDRVILHPGSFIGDKVIIGDDAEIFPNVTILERCILGSRVTIHAGTVIGSDGFGYADDGEKYHKIPQTGIVRIEDDVEIGANNTIDRATFGKTWIKNGVKTDNLVHIAHNVIVGENTVLAGMVGISGSVTIGEHVVFAGKAGVIDHLSIGDRSIIGPRATVLKSVPADEVLSGSPGMSHKLWLRVQSIIPKLPQLNKKLSELEKKVDRLHGR